MKRKTWLRQKRQRRLSIWKQCCKKRTQNRTPGHRQRTVWNVGIWNVRRWGATFTPYDPWLKTQAIFRLAKIRNWDIIILADVNMSDTEMTTVTVDSDEWSIILNGKVGIALNARTTTAWTAGGRRVYKPRPTQGRSLMVHLPRKGYTKGLAIIAAYAPISSARNQDITCFYDELSQVKQAVPAGDILLIGGDFNSEVGSEQVATNPVTLGPWVGPNSSKRGPELLAWCQKEGLTIADTRYQQPLNKRYTWWHPTFKTGHILDHVMTPPNQLKFFDNIKTVHEGRRGNAGDPLGRPSRHAGPNPTRLYWDDFTDHLPVEANLHYYPKWKKPRTQSANAQSPDVAKLATPTAESRELKQRWQNALDDAIGEYRGNHQQLSWEQITQVCLSTGLQVMGPKPHTRKRPHLLWT